MIRSNPCSGVDLPAKPDEAEFEGQPLTRGGVAALATELDRWEPYGLAGRLLAAAGLRAAEFAGLHIDDLNFDRGTVSVVRTLTRDRKTEEGSSALQRAAADVERFRSLMTTCSQISPSTCAPIHDRPNRTHHCSTVAPSVATASTPRSRSTRTSSINGISSRRRIASAFHACESTTSFATPLRLFGTRTASRYPS